MFDKTDDVPPAATDGNQEGEQSAETLKENIRLIEVCSVLYVYYAIQVHWGDIALIAKGELHLSQKDYLVNLDTALFFLTGDAVAPWLVRSTPERVVWVRALAWDIALCSWAKHFTLTVPLSRPPRCINGYQQIVGENLTNCREVTC